VFVGISYDPLGIGRKVNESKGGLGPSLPPKDQNTVFPFEYLQSISHEWNWN